MYMAAAKEHYINKGEQSNWYEPLGGLSAPKATRTLTHNAISTAKDMFQPAHTHKSICHLQAVSFPVIGYCSVETALAVIFSPRRARAPNSSSSRRVSPFGFFSSFAAEGDF